jgi:hypothetical protein
MGRATSTAWALASCMLAVGSGQGIRPPCELNPDTLNGRGATLREYAEPDPHRIYCHLDHLCDRDGNPSGACVIPDGESCLVDCDAGYEDDHHSDTNQLHCKPPPDQGHLPELEFDFSCTGTPPRC